MKDDKDVFTDEERIAIAEWLGWEWRAKNNPNFGRWWRPGHDCHTGSFPTYQKAESLPRWESQSEWPAIFEELAVEHGFSLWPNWRNWRKTPKHITFSCGITGVASGLPGYAPGHRSIGEAVGRAVLSVMTSKVRVVKMR